MKKAFLRNCIYLDNLLAKELVFSPWLRFSSDGYRLNPNQKVSFKIDENKTEREKFDEKVEKCFLSKAKSPLYGLEQVHLNSIKDFPLPNDKFLGKVGLPVYGSHENYAKAAERQRRAYQENPPPWSTMDKYWKSNKDSQLMKNFGKDLPQKSQDAIDIKNILKENKIKLEEISRKRTLKLDEIDLNDQWEHQPDGMMSIFRVAQHYGIYKDLFGSKYFYPVVPIEISYICDDNFDEINPVFYGNDLSPSETSKSPCVSFESDEESLWTLVMVNIDGNLEKTNRQCLHWMIGNIKGNNLDSGDVVVDYSIPLPMRGTGFHRIAFTLFQQNTRINYESIQRKLPCADISERSFKMKSFYKRFRKQLTPVSLKFFQTCWDKSVQQYFHQLDMAEPIYSYEIEPKHMAPLSRYPVPGRKKTLEWLENFMPKEPIYPGGGSNL